MSKAVMQIKEGVEIFQGKGHYKEDSLLMNVQLFQDMRHVQLKIRRGCSLVKVP